MTRHALCDISFILQGILSCYAQISSIYNFSSLVCVSLSWLSDLEKGENITDQHCTVENLLTCPTDSKINGVTVQSGRVPNSITFDGPVLCCSISSGNGFLIPLLSLPSQLITSKIGNDFFR